MKSTQERLSEVYCRPTEKEWLHFEKLSDGDTIVIKWGGEVITTSLENLGSASKRKAEITVSRFIDLLHDSIVPWRLEEDGFDIQDGITYFETVAGSFRIEANGEVSHIVTGRTASVDTYTDLLTLIRLIG